MKYINDLVARLRWRRLQLESWLILFIHFCLVFMLSVALTNDELNLFY